MKPAAALSSSLEIGPRRLRLAMVARHYWPTTNGSGTLLGQLAVGLRDEGIDCTIDTPQWGPAWSEQIVHRGTPIVRLPVSGYRPWRGLRYGWSLARWLRRHASQFDAIYVSELKHEAAAAVTVGKKCGAPVVLRAENTGLTGDCHWQLNASLGRRIKHRCGQAAALLASSVTLHSELIAAGFRRDRIHLAPLGAPPAPPRDASSRAESREALAAACPALTVPENGPLAVFVGRLTDDKGLSELLAAWSIVAQFRPAARLWIIGEGPRRMRLESQVEALGLAGRVVLPGAFDDVQDMLAAADLFVYPTHEAGTATSLLEAMAAGLPIVASDIPDNRQLLDAGRCGLLASAEEPAIFAAAIQQTLDHPTFAASLGQAARSRVQERFSLDATIRWHAELFRGLVLGGPVTRPASPSSE